MASREVNESRRRFLQWVSASPLLAASGLTVLAPGEQLAAHVGGQDPRIWAPSSTDQLITSPKEAINGVRL